MTRNLTAVSFLCIAVAAVVSTAAMAQGPGGGPGGNPGEMMGAMMYLERTWTAASFQLDCASEQLAALKPTYRNALNARDTAVKAAFEAQDWEAVGKAMIDCKKRIEAKLKEVLSSAQMTKLNELMAPPRPPAGAGAR